MKIIIKSVAIFLCLLPIIVWAKDPLPVDQAFKFSAYAKSQNAVVVEWDIAPGYYLYRERFHFSDNSNRVELGSPAFPKGDVKQDPFFGKQEVFHHKLSVIIPVKEKSSALPLVVTYQGCSDHGFCYPPTTQTVQLNLRGDFGVKVSGKEATGLSEPAPQLSSEQDRITAILANSQVGWVLLAFFGFGLLLTFTPCVLPMVPILSGIIIGHGKDLTTRKAFLLSLTYVLSMSLTYALAGVVVALLGANLQAAMQNPWVIGVFSLVFVLLALSLFGFYELQLPARWQQKLNAVSNRQAGGHYLGVAIMGCLSTLIVSPCVSAPLVGALGYIAQTGSAWLGGSALFVMGLGMGAPLLVVGTSGGRFLPKAGGWMDGVKVFFGVMMLAVAIWLLSRIIPGWTTMLLTSMLSMLSAWYLGVFRTVHTNLWHRVLKSVGFILMVYSVILIAGVCVGNTNPLRPLEVHTQRIETKLPFVKIKSRYDLDEQLDQAKGKPVMLDFYADWCISCKVMEHGAFADPRVRDILSHYVLLQADVTSNDRIDKALEKSLGVVAPPSIIFYGPGGQEMKNYRVVGEMSADEFLHHLQRLQQTMK